MDNDNDKPKKRSRSLYDTNAGEVVGYIPPPKRVTARATSYHPDYCEKVLDHMKDGYSFMSFAATINVAPSTLYRWCEAHPAFDEAKERGEVLSLLFWETQGKLGLTMGKSFNATVWIFSMKNRFRKFGWKDRFEDDGSGGDASKQPATLQLTPGDLAQLIQVARGQKSEEKVVVEVKAEDIGNPDKLK